MHLAEHLELAAERFEHEIVADQPDALRRGSLPPSPAREGPQAGRSDGRRDEQREDRQPVQRPRGSEGQEQGDHGGQRRDPGENRGNLVCREMAKGTMIAVVEAEELRDQWPERDEEHRPERFGGRHQCDHRRDCPRAEVGERKHPATTRITPPAAMALRELPAEGRGWNEDPTRARRLCGCLLLCEVGHYLVI